MILSVKDIKTNMFFSYCVNDGSISVDRILIDCVSIDFDAVDISIDCASFSFLLKRRFLFFLPKFCFIVDFLYLGLNSTKPFLLCALE